MLPPRIETRLVMQMTHPMMRTNLPLYVAPLLLAIMALTLASGVAADPGTPAHSALPTVDFPGVTRTLNITAGAGAPHSGSNITVWDPAANATIIVGAGCPLWPGPSGGTKWLLTADVDGDGFDDGLVSYSIPLGGSIAFEFGDGDNVTITTAGGATVAPPGSGVTYAWVDNLGVAGTDQTNTVGTYKFGSCGTEAAGASFEGTTTFIVKEIPKEVPEFAAPAIIPAAAAFLLMGLRRLRRKHA